MKCIFFLSLFFILGCSSDFKEAVGSSYKVLVSENVRANEKGEVGGRGAILYNTPLRSIKSAEHFYVHGRLLQEGSYLTVISHAVDTMFNGSVKVRLLREAEESIGLLVGLDGQEFYELAHFERLLSRDGEFFIRFEIHNNGDQGLRLIFWSVKEQNLSKEWRQKKSFYLKNAKYDSFAAGDQLLKKGKGVLWGASFYDAYIKSIINEAPYVN